jgi:hypothetical protein
MIGSEGKNMAGIDPPQRQTCRVGEARTPAVSFVGVLESGELLTGTPTVVEVTTSDLTITNEVVNTAAITINSKSVAIGQAVQFKVTGQAAASSPYTLRVTASTDADPAQTIIRDLTLLVVA